MALILSRTVDQGVVLQDERGRRIARVFIARVTTDGHHQVKLGFEAGPEVQILRDELVGGEAAGPVARQNGRVARSTLH